MVTKDFVYKKVLIFDGSNCLHRAITEPHLWNMSYNGIKTGGIYGVLQIIMKEFKLYNYYPIVIFDGNLSKRRLQIYPNYKHNLDKSMKKENVSCETFYDNVDWLYDNNESIEYCQKQEYTKQRDTLIQLLPLIGIPTIRFENWEGDDIIAYLSSVSEESIIVSEDKDLYQLISEIPKCYIKHGMKNKIVDIQELIKQNLTPKQFMLYKCLLGDPSDNIPSTCPKIGPKHVESLYKLYEHSILNNVSYPTSESDLNSMCELLKIPKRQALLNFSENQFLINLALIDLSIPINEIPPILKSHIHHVVYNTLLDVNANSLDKFYEFLKMYNILTFNINSIHTSLNNAKLNLFM